jgi:hypothetical protein
MRSLARLAAFSFALIALPLAAQIRGVPPSVTSIGGSHSPGIPASVTSINNTPRCCRTTVSPNQFAFRNQFAFGNQFVFPQHRHIRGRFNGRFVGSGFLGSGFQPLFIEVPVAVPVEEPVEVVDEPEPAAMVDRPVQRVIVRKSDPPPAPSVIEVPAPAQPAKPLPATILVFRDGHQIEVRDYAISGDTFYDLSNGLTKKIWLGDLDVDATIKANDARGIPFILPRQTS